MYTFTLCKVKCHKNNNSFVNKILFENQGQAVCLGASLAAALFGSQPLVSLLGNGQTDSLSSGHRHPGLVALEPEEVRSQPFRLVKWIHNKKETHQVHTKSFYHLVSNYFTHIFSPIHYLELCYGVYRFTVCKY